MEKRLSSVVLGKITENNKLSSDEKKVKLRMELIMMVLLMMLLLKRG